ncbi:MAG: hypothetical protein Q9219_005249 [cf. Caloplaca sp. 3 TL-2023]
MPPLEAPSDSSTSPTTKLPHSEKDYTSVELLASQRTSTPQDGQAHAFHNRAVEVNRNAESPIGPTYDIHPELGNSIDTNGTTRAIEQLKMSSDGSCDQPMSEEVPSGNNATEQMYLDPTPRTHRLSANSSRTPSPASYNDESLQREENCDPTKSKDGATTSEIQSIIEQFDGGSQDHAEEVVSPRLDFANSMLANAVQYPPRRSSLEPTRSPTQAHHDGTSTGASAPSSVPDSWQPPVPQVDASLQGQDKAPSMRSSNTPQSSRGADQVNDPSSAHSSISGPRLQPPEPEPESEIPFDFHRFLEQLRHRTADPVAKFLRSFLIEFGKKQWMVHEQVKIVSDFLTFIAGKMAQCDVWRGATDVEFDNAKEGMEKLVMSRLYAQTFSPAIPPLASPSDGKGRRKNMEKLLGPGRKGQHQEDIERDEVLGQKVRIYRWVQEEHLDIPPLGENGRRFMSFAQQQLLKIKIYRAPRDKVVCVLNCCKVIFGFLRTSRSADTSADSFVPLLIYVVLRANPEHVVSNIQYILRFRNQEKLSGEAGYYLSSLMGAIQFIENLDRTSLTISDDEFERNVEASVSEIAERHEEEEEEEEQKELPPPPPPAPPPRPTHVAEKSGLSEPEMVARNSLDAEYNISSRPLSSHAPVYRRSGTGSQEDSNAVSGLLRTIQKPLSSIGRMFSEDTSIGQSPSSQSHPQQPLQSNAPLRLSPAVFQPPRRSHEEARPPQDPSQTHPRRINAEEAAARQASSETAEAHRIQSIEHQDVVG